jgi:hypothetical protein
VHTRYSAPARVRVGSPRLGGDFEGATPTGTLTGVTDEPRRRSGTFTYDGYDLTPDGVLTCTYSTDGEVFTERFAFTSDDADFAGIAVGAAARLVFLLAGVSYYKTSAAHVIRMPEGGLTERERSFLRDYYVSGLAEFSYRPEGVDISDLTIEAGHRSPAPAYADGRVSAALVPFGGGIDSVVVADAIRDTCAETALFVANTSDAPFEPIEETAAVFGLPIRRVRRHLDPKVLKSSPRHYFNGHVPVTGILSAAAVLSAVAHGHDRVVMSNEHSADEPTALRANGVAVNHQWSKSLAFEEGFRDVLAESVTGVTFYSALRPHSELWVSRRFAELTDFHQAFRSCNQAFYVDEAERLATWCGRCDKCCFTDLILAPYLSVGSLERIFRGAEPLANPDRLALPETTEDDGTPRRVRDVFSSLLGQPGVDKPLECVGDEGECRTAVRLAAARPDRRHDVLLAELARHVDELGKPVPTEDDLLQVLSRHFIPAAATR